MCEELGEGANLEEVGTVTGRQWGEIEEGYKASEQYQGIGQGCMESLSRWWHVCIRKDGICV